MLPSPAHIFLPLSVNFLHFRKYAIPSSKPMSVFLNVVTQLSTHNSVCAGQGVGGLRKMIFRGSLKVTSISNPGLALGITVESRLVSLRTVCIFPFPTHSSLHVTPLSTSQFLTTFAWEIAAASTWVFLGPWEICSSPSVFPGAGDFPLRPLV